MLQQTLHLTKPPLTGRTSVVWRWFSIYNKEEKKSRCDLCAETADFSANTVQMRRHLQKVHKPEFAEMIESEQSRRTKDSFQYGLQHRLVTWIVSNSFPFSTVENDDFRELMSFATNKPFQLGVDQVLETIDYRSFKLKSEFTRILKDSTSVAITGDKWSSGSTESYYGITLHRIHNFELESFPIACAPFPGYHKAKDLDQKILKILEDYDIPVSKIVGLTMDNEPTANATGDLLPFQWIGCIAHLINIVCNNVVEAENAIWSTTLVTMRKLIGSIHKSDILTYFLHQYQVEDGKPESETLRVVQYVETRWWSYYKSIQRMLELKKYINKLYTEKHTKAKLENQDWVILRILEDSLKPFATWQCKLETEKAVTISLVPRIVVELKRIIDKSRYAGGTNPAGNNIIYQSIGEKLYEKFKIRFGTMADSKTIWEEHLSRGEKNIRKGIQEAHWIAAALDPRTKSLKELDPLEREKIYAIIREKMEKITIPDDTPEDNGTPGSPMIVVDYDDEDDNFEGIIGTSDPFSYSMPNVSVELANYRGVLEQSSLNINPLEFWRLNQRQFPRLCILAEAYLSIQATSASSERVFSTSGNDISPKRNRIVPERVESVVLLHKNHDFYLQLDPPPK